MVEEGFRLLNNLDAELRTKDIKRQYEILDTFPEMFCGCSPIIVSASFLKLADFFKDGNNALRTYILRACVSSHQLIGKINNIDEIVRRLMVVLSSNDPFARSLSLRMMGAFSSACSDRPEVHYSIASQILYGENSLEEWRAIAYASKCLLEHSHVFTERLVQTLSHTLGGDNQLNAETKHYINSILEEISRTHDSLGMVANAMSEKFVINKR